MTDKNKTTKTCRICGSDVSDMRDHIKTTHGAAYKAGDLAVVGVIQQMVVEDKRVKLREEAASNTAVRLIPAVPEHTLLATSMTELFNIPADENTINSQGKPQMVDVRINVPEDDVELIPDLDPGYVFNSALVKDILVGIKLGLPVYAWGMHGTGKSTLFEQICHYTNRPLYRVQHSATTEESHIVGQMVVRDGATVFDYGPLPLAMINGWAYLADEYDFAQPAVIALYQAVLEGKPLVIKEAPPHMRVIKPHPHFRFFATGNTNGSGDDTGLYQGTVVQNAAAYSRFGVTVNVTFPEQKVEAQMLVRQTSISEKSAEFLVDLATRIRTQYQSGDISAPISPREVISAAKLGLVFGSKFEKGVALAFANRLGEVDKAAVMEMAKKMFG